MFFIFSEKYQSTGTVFEACAPPRRSDAKHKSIEHSCHVLRPRFSFRQVWNKLDNMNEQLAIKRSMQLMSLFGNIGSSKELLNEEPQVRK